MTIREIMSNVNFMEHAHFDLVENRRSKFRKVHALLMLGEVAPEVDDVILGALNDSLYLAPDMEVLEQRITVEQAIELRRCGVFYDSDHDVLRMWC